MSPAVVTSLEKNAKKAKKAWKADKSNEELKKAWKAAKKALAKAQEESQNKEAEVESSANDEADEEKSDSPSLEDLKSALAEAKKAWKANKEDKKLKKAFKKAKKAVAEFESSESAPTSGKKRKRESDDVEDAPAKKAKEEESSEEKVEVEEDSEMKVKDNSLPTSHPNANEKIFCGNLSFDVDDDAIREFFKDCGELTDIFWLKDRDTGNFKGCGFVTFENKESACKAIELNGTEFMGRELRLDFAKPRPGGDRKTPRKGRESRPLSEKPEGCNTVFCGNLSFDIDDTKVQEFATEAGCGTISHIRWLTDRDTGDFKGCGFVEFENPDDVDLFVKKNGCDLMGRSVRLDYAKPRAPRN